MKSRIILNFNDLHGICEETKAYRDALDEMKYAIEKINLRLESENSGEAVNALVDSSKELLNDIQSCYLEVNDLNEIFTSYVDEMSSIISPKNPSKNMLVDRDDIWWNLDSIKNTCNSISNLPSVLNLSSFSSELSEDEKQNRIDNARKVQEIIGLTKRYEYILQDSVYDLERLFNTKVVDFETKDDEFGRRARKDIYNNYTSILERIVDYEVWNISTTFKFVKGVVFSLKDLVVGIASLVIGVDKYIRNCEIAVISDALGFLNCDVPDWMESARESRNASNINLKETAITLLNHPMIFVEGMAESIHNAYEEEGLAFCSGYAAMEILGAKGVGNLAKSSKVSKVSKTVDKTVDVVKTIKVTDSVHDVDKALDAVKDVRKANKYSLSGEEHYECLKDLFGADNVKWETKGKKYDTAIFADGEKLVSHYWKHRKEFGAYSLDDYLNQAREVMNNGYEVNYPYKGEIRTGFLEYYGNSRKNGAKFAFVGTNNDGFITTFHTESGKTFWKMLNEQNIKVINPK